MCCVDRMNAGVFFFLLSLFFIPKNKAAFMVHLIRMRFHSITGTCSHGKQSKDQIRERGSDKFYLYMFKTHFFFSLNNRTDKVSQHVQFDCQADETKTKKNHSNCNFSPQILCKPVLIEK